MKFNPVDLVNPIKKMLWLRLAALGESVVRPLVFSTERVRKEGRHSVYMPVFVLGELCAGFKNGSKERENLTRLRSFLSKNTVQVLHATMETAELFGEIKNRLRSAGTPIPINDVWIASQTFQTGAFLITYDRHFLQVPGLLVWKQLRNSG